MQRFRFWQRWLMGVALAMLVLGIAIAFLSGTALFDPINRLIDPVFFGDQVITMQVLSFRRWVYGVLGATTVGWAVSTLFVAVYSFRRKERWAWTCILVSLLAWYAIDTPVSLAFGVIFNAAMNTVILAAALLALGMTRRDFVAEGAAHPLPGG